MPAIDCPACRVPVQVEPDGLIGCHDNWGQGGAYGVRCPASGRTPTAIAELLGGNESTARSER